MKSTTGWAQAVEYNEDSEEYDDPGKVYSGNGNNSSGFDGRSGG
jgi:hypothetical protein